MIKAKEQAIAELRAQIDRKGAYTEKECAECLKDNAWALLPTLDGTITYLDCEQLCSAGRVDMIVIAEILEIGGNTRQGAYVWELKAPQLPLAIIQKQNQASPSPHLFEAENQLLNYHDSVKLDGHFRDRWGIVSSDDIRYGGIVIGRTTDSFLFKDMDPVLANQLGRQTLRIRDAVFYRPHGIRIWTWDIVLTILESQTISHRKFMGDPSVRIEPGQAESESFIAGSPCQMSGQKCLICKEGILDVTPAEDGVRCGKCGFFLPAIKLPL